MMWVEAAMVGGCLATIVFMIGHRAGFKAGVQRARRAPLLEPTSPRAKQLERIIERQRVR